MKSFESCLSEVQLKLSESDLGFTLKREQELSMGHLFKGIDVMAVLPTAFGKGLKFSDVCHDVRSSRNKIKQRTGFYIAKHHARSSG